jgi:hypothetical protein
VRNGQEDVDQAMDPFSAFGGQVIWRTDYTVKRGLLFSRPKRDVTNQTLPGGKQFLLGS